MTVNVTGKQHGHEGLSRAIEPAVERVDNPGERRTVGKRPEKIQHRTNRRRACQGHNRKLRARRYSCEPGIRLGESVEILLAATVDRRESNGRPMFRNVFLRLRLHGTERTSGDHPVNRPDLFDNNAGAVDEIGLRSCRLVLIDTTRYNHVVVCPRRTKHDIFQGRPARGKRKRSKTWRKHSGYCAW